jgi:GldM C-terminal domain
MLISSVFSYAQKAVVSADKMNVVYIGVDNPISLAVSGYEANEISISVSEGTLIKEKNGKYIYRCTKMPKQGEVMFFVSGTKNKKVKVLDTAFYRVKRVPDPRVKYYCFHKSSETCFSDLYRNGLKVELENFDFDVDFFVTDFDIEITLVTANEFSKFHNNGSYLSTEVKNFLKEVKPGDKISITNIGVSGPDSVKRIIDENPMILVN